jgi:uncharacterized protein YecE (DUF72 family)
MHASDDMASSITAITAPSPGTLRIGCAGWSLPRVVWPRFPAEGSHLERYAARLDCVEINSSFYRPHRHETYRRWADSCPESFRFSVKLPKAITHAQRLQGSLASLDEFLAQVAGLADKLGCLLIQLPPSLALEPEVLERFLSGLRQRHGGAVALEPRHASGFGPAIEDMLGEFRVARVLADPVLHAGGESPGGWPGLVYLRLHGTPKLYRSPYEEALLKALAARLLQAAREGVDGWCIFDNTAAGEAVGNALTLAEAISAAARMPQPRRPGRP